MLRAVCCLQVLVWDLRDGAASDPQRPILKYEKDDSQVRGMGSFLRKYHGQRGFDTQKLHVTYTLRACLSSQSTACTLALSVVYCCNNMRCRVQDFCISWDASCHYLAAAFGNELIVWWVGALRIF